MNTKKRADERDCKFNLVIGTAYIVDRVLTVTNVLEALKAVSTVEEALVS